MVLSAFRAILVTAGDKVIEKNSWKKTQENPYFTLNTRKIVVFLGFFLVFFYDQVDTGHDLRRPTA